MKIKYFYYLVILLISSFKGYSQDPDRKHSVGLYQNFTDYNVVLFGNKIFAFDSSLSQTTRVAYQRRLSRTWMLNAGLSNGFILNQNIRESFVDRAFVFGSDASVMFKINNGRILKENPRIAPYLTFGYRMDYVPYLSKLNESPVLFLNQYGLGFNVKLGDRTHLQIQSVLDQKLTSDFNTHMQYRFGITQSLGVLAYKEKPLDKSNDSDKDGIVNSMDKCPDVYGIAAYDGCPSDSTDRNVNSDSLKRIVVDQRLALENLQKELEELRNAGLTNSISKSREQELLLRIYNLQKSKDEEILSLKKRLSEAEKEDDKKAKVVTKKEEPLKKEVGKAEPKAIDVEPTISADKNYYVITISSPNLSTATSWLAKMKETYPDAVILPQSNGYFRVGVYVGKDRLKGLEIREQVAKDGFTNAWLSIE